MKLLFQSDDYGITDGVTCGILKGIRDGLIRNTGLFVNMESSARAAEFIADYPNCCFGLDINLVAGSPVSDPTEVPSLVKPSGEFYTSGEIRQRAGTQPGNSLLEVLPEDPYPMEETLTEVRNQAKRFMELTGKLPGYIHPHSLMTPNTTAALQTVADELGIPFSMRVLTEKGFHPLTNTWNPKPFPVSLQLETDVEGEVMKVIHEVEEHEQSVLICHAGFVDEDIFRHSTYTIIRLKDLNMACSTRLRDWLEEHEVELITYRDL